MNQLTDSKPNLHHGISNTNANENACDHLILGSRMIHDVFITMNPKLNDANPEHIKLISDRIHAYLFGKNSGLEKILEICDEEITIEAIQGIRNIIKEVNIQDIQGIEAYLIKAKEIFRPVDIPKITPIS